MIDVAVCAILMSLSSVVAAAVTDWLGRREKARAMKQVRAIERIVVASEIGSRMMLATLAAKHKPHCPECSMLLAEWLRAVHDAAELPPEPSTAPAPIEGL